MCGESVRFRTQNVRFRTLFSDLVNAHSLSIKTLSFWHTFCSMYFKLKIENT